MWRWVVGVATQLISQICRWRALVGSLLHAACLRSYHGLSLLLSCANVQGRNALLLSFGKKTFTIYRILCHAGPRLKPTELKLQSWRDDVAQLLLIHVWWFLSQIAWSSHLNPLLNSQTQSSLTTSYTSRTEEAMASGRVGASSWALVAVDLICLPQPSSACCYNELEGFNYTGVISHTSA